MPELPDLTIYIEALHRRVTGRRLERIRLASPFFLRTVDPPLGDAHGRMVCELRRIGKRIVFGLEGKLFLVVHLMVTGRFHWRQAGAKIPQKVGLAAFDFAHGTLMLTEAATTKLAALHLVCGEHGLRQFDLGGIEPLTADVQSFRTALTRENYTVKRALTEPRLFSGIGNAYSDEILHRARVSPVERTVGLTDDNITRLFEATRTVLSEWIDRLRIETGDRFPEKVTAFHENMAVHGRYGRTCPVCRSPVQRIVYAKNETNYCPTCQTGGKLLADRALSRLLKSDRPKSLQELDGLRAKHRQSNDQERGWNLNVLMTASNRIDSFNEA
ncbi:MAG TPA: DNA-formamidopyrimidine glycosylase family protein [Nitrospiraceae bacterium]|nr:DNA-formamidopyrimidine glycosylase family protein [Nitrospiraceae bacterium]